MAKENEQQTMEDYLLRTGHAGGAEGQPGVHGGLHPDEDQERLQ